MINVFLFPHFVDKFNTFLKEKLDVIKTPVTYYSLLFCKPVGPIWLWSIYLATTNLVDIDSTKILFYKMNKIFLSFRN